MYINVAIEEYLNVMKDELYRKHAEIGVTLGHLIDILKFCPPDMPVKYNNCYPGDFISYRGYYERLALTPSLDPIDCKTLLARANEANGSTFEGYKGGEFKMHLGTLLHRACYGDCGTIISGFEQKNGVLYILDEEYA